VGEKTLAHGYLKGAYKQDKLHDFLMAKWKAQTPKV
jgi:hypothetical protein